MTWRCFARCVFIWVCQFVRERDVDCLFHLLWRERECVLIYCVVLVFTSFYEKRRPAPVDVREWWVCVCACVCLGHSCWVCPYPSACALPWSLRVLPSPCRMCFTSRHWVCTCSACVSSTPHTLLQRKRWISFTVCFKRCSFERTNPPPLLFFFFLSSSCVAYICAELLVCVPFRVLTTQFCGGQCAVNWGLPFLSTYSPVFAGESQDGMFCEFFCLFMQNSVHKVWWMGC